MRDGKIVTFYSFKGGVGRSMALANVAYIAACNGMRVLVMDWDLEAPGLAYYYRGLLDSGAARALNAAPGVLNFLWAWRNDVAALTTTDDAQRLVERADSGALFAPAVQPIGVGFVGTGQLDYIGAGSSQEVEGIQLGYADALARFSWTDFYDEFRGPLLVQSLRRWAKSEYDLVLVDSRTGLADVAGLCTMQLPDAVALCFILNRQNITGAATVAGAIRAQRHEQVEVRAVPMRVQRQDTPEQSDAWARAIGELVTVGGFSTETAADDMRRLGVAVDAAIPFYEVLAPFAASNPQLDPLTLNYVQLASELLGCRFDIPRITELQTAKVRARLQPRQATVDYVRKLKDAEPGRAWPEIQRLLTSAQEVASRGLVDVEYIEALVDVALSLDDVLMPGEAEVLQGQAADLLRDLYASSNDLWRLSLVTCLERIVTNGSTSRAPEITLSLLEEIDVLLSAVNTTASKLRRLRLRRMAAWQYLQQGDQDGGHQTVGEVFTLTRELSRDQGRFALEQLEQVVAAEMDMHLYKAESHRLRNEPVQALEEYGRALARLQLPDPSPDLRQLKARAHTGIAIHSPDEASSNAARHAIEAVRASVNDGFVWFCEFVALVSRSSERRALSVELAHVLFATDAAAMEQYLGSYHGRTAVTAMAFCEAVATLVEGAAHVDDETLAAFRRLTTAVEVALRTVIRRRHAMGRRAADGFEFALTRLQRALRLAGITWEMPERLQDDVESMWPAYRQLSSAQ